MILAIQILVVVLLVAAFGLWLKNFPYPSPLIRRLLPPRLRWPEAQIRAWLVSGRFHRGYLAFFYRDPERRPPPGGGLLAPSDGLITSSDSRDGVRFLVIALSFWDMHTQYAPLAGRVTQVESLGSAHMDGEGRDFAFLRDKTCPVQTRITMATTVGTIAVRLITSIAARRIECWVEPGQELSRGQRIGRILLGSTVVLELPMECALTVSPGQRVRAGETVVAENPREGV